MSDKQQPSVPTNSVGYAMPLTVLFVALKLTGVIDWSWWWVLAPVWIGAIIVAVCFAILLSIAVAKR